MNTATHPGLLAQLWLDRLEALGRQLPTDQVAHHAFVATWKDGRWPPAGSDLELAVIRLRLGMCLVAIYSAAATAAAAGSPMAVSLAELLKFIPFRLLESEQRVVEEQYAHACSDLDLGNSPSPVGVQ